MERLAARAQRLVDLGCSRVVILEATGSFGDGRIHSATQVRTSALNRVASQVGFGADEALLGAPLLPVALRPTLAEWLERGASAAPEDPEAPQAAWGIPTRATHGAALRSCFVCYADCLRAHGITVHQLTGTAIDVIPTDSDVEVTWTDEGQTRTERVAAALLTTGHGTGRPRGPGGARVCGPYPLDLAVMSPGEDLLPSASQGIHAATRCRGNPKASVTTERFVPCLPRSTGERPETSPPQGDLVIDPSTDRS